MDQHVLWLFGLLEYNRTKNEVRKTQSMNTGDDEDDGE